MPVLPAPSDSDMVYTFAVSLTVYCFIKKKGQSNFLQTCILDRHGQDQYKLSAKKQFAFKYIPPKSLLCFFCYVNYHVECV